MHAEARTSVRKNVDFPEPLGPTIPINSPPKAEKSAIRATGYCFLFVLYPILSCSVRKMICAVPEAILF